MRSKVAKRIIGNTPPEVTSKAIEYANNLINQRPMTLITITRAAKCKDCWFIQPIYHGKRKRHFCNNHNSKYHKAQITLNDLVCDKWQLIGDENQQK